MKERTGRYATIVVGAGIIGLATALELLRRYPGISVAVLDKNREVGREQTGHNSGVIHAGIYYKPGSLKAKLCVAGRNELFDFCEKHNIPVDRCGKVIVATEESELGRLDDLFERGVANGVPGLEVIGPERLREIEPHAAGIKAVLSPTTSIVDYGLVTKAYADEVRALGGDVLLGADVLGLRRDQAETVVETSRGRLLTRTLIGCAGLQSDKVAQMAGAPADLKIVPFRGDYYMLKPEKRYLARTLIYPVPDPNLPFLGVHFTKRIDGEIWAGPNAVLAFARQGYKRTDINVGDNVDLLSYPGFWRMAKTYWQIGIDEMARDFYKPLFVRSLQRYVPEVKSDDLVLGPSGVRAQAVDTAGKLVDDFSVFSAENMIHVRNAPSPGATSSLAIGKLIVDKAVEVFTVAPFNA